MEITDYKLGLLVYKCQQHRHISLTNIVSQLILRHDIDYIPPCHHC